MPGISGFLTFKDAKKVSIEELRLGQLVGASVSRMSENGRTCTVTADPASYASASVCTPAAFILNNSLFLQLSEITNVTSILPGTLVQSLITSVVPSGLNVQVLGYFDGTVDQVHLPSNKEYKVGQKVKARILYDVSGFTPPRFALALASHIVGLDVKRANGETKSGERPRLQDTYPVGTILDVKVVSVEPERGLMVGVEPNAVVEGFVHVGRYPIFVSCYLWLFLQISQTSDDHVPSLSLSSGPWKIGTSHRARVTGHFPFDGLLQLSLRPSILGQNYLQVGDVKIGEVIKGTINRLSDSGLFVSISDSVDGVVWPNHYADITLKHPSKRFKPGASIKCRVSDITAYDKC